MMSDDVWWCLRRSMDLYSSMDSRVISRNFADFRDLLWCLVGVWVKDGVVLVVRLGVVWGVWVRRLGGLGFRRWIGICRGVLCRWVGLWWRSCWYRIWICRVLGFLGIRVLMLWGRISSSRRVVRVGRRGVGIWGAWIRRLFDRLRVGFCWWKGVVLWPKIVFCRLRGFWCWWVRGVFL